MMRNTILNMSMERVTTIPKGSTLKRVETGDIQK